MYAPEKDIVAENSLEVVHEAPEQGASAVGALAAKETVEVKHRTPEECAAGRVEHLMKVFEGEEERFRFYGVFDEPHHFATFQAMNAYLGLPEYDPTTAEPKKTVVLTDKSGISLVRWSNVDQQGIPFDVYYQTFRADELLEAGIEPVDYPTL